MTLRDRFQALFSPHRRWLAPELPALALGGWLGPRQLVVPRALCVHKRLAFPGLDPARRAAALGVAVHRIAPQAGSAVFSRWQGEHAQVWVAPPEVVRDADPAAVLLAESALVPVPAGGDALRLVRLQRGIEGQVWQSGILVASHWWPELPDAADWVRFLRSAGQGVDVDPKVPVPEQPALAPHPWGEQERSLSWSPVQLERAFWRFVIANVALVLGWQLAAAVTWGIAGAWQESRLSALRNESAPLIEARETAEAARARIDGLAALARGPSDLLLIADVRERLPEGARLLTWLRDGGSLRMEVQGTAPDPRLFVQAFRGHPVLAGVVANPLEGGRMELDIDLDGPSGQAGSP